MKLWKALITTVLIFTTTACSMGKSVKFSTSSAASIAPVDANSFGGGQKVVGTGAMSVPTADALVVRIQNGLQNNVSAQAGNFKTALTQIKGNLPSVSDPTKATGFDVAELLIYAACSDLTTGTTPKMQSFYNVTKAGTVAANQANLISAGIKILDQHLAGLASQGPTASDVKQVFTELVQKISADSVNTSTVAFVTVCIAANTSGATLMSF